ncbi:hypothetical protein ACTL6U_15720 [Rhodovibrionaceae bacterium A322]
MSRPDDRAQAGQLLSATSQPATSQATSSQSTTGSKRQPKYDPKGRMSAVLLEGQSCPQRPQDVLLAWLLELPKQLDPAFAATSLLTRWKAANCPTLKEEKSRELFELVEQVSRFPREQIQALANSRRDRRRQSLSRQTTWTPARGRVSSH